MIAPDRAALAERLTEALSDMVRSHDKACRRASRHAHTDQEYLTYRMQFDESHERACAAAALLAAPLNTDGECVECLAGIESGDGHNEGCSQRAAPERETLAAEEPTSTPAPAPSEDERCEACNLRDETVVYRADRDVPLCDACVVALDASEPAPTLPAPDALAERLAQMAKLAYYRTDAVMLVAAAAALRARPEREQIADAYRVWWSHAQAGQCHAHTRQADAFADFLLVRLAADGKNEVDR